MTVKFEQVDGSDDVLVKFTNTYLSYPYVFERRADSVDDDGNKKRGKFTANFCFPRSDAQSKADAIAIHRKAQELAKEKLKTSIAANKMCLQDGKQLDEAMHPYFVLRASDDTKPDVVDRRLKPVTAEDDLIYPGCIVNGTVKLWVQNHPKYGKRVNANLIAIQFVKHSERWGGRVRPKVESVFSDISGQFEDDEYAGGPTGDGAPDPGDDGFGDEDGL